MYTGHEPESWILYIRFPDPDKFLKKEIEEKVKKKLHSVNQC